MTGKRILIGSPVRESPEILKEYADSLMNLDREGIKTEFLFIDDNVNRESVEVLHKLTKLLPGTIMAGDGKSPGNMSDFKHKWDIDSISRVSEYRNRILEIARDGDYDGLFFVDSDLLLHPKTLIHLIEQDKDIISEIYWTRWAPSGPLYPQVWMYDNYTQYEPCGAVVLRPDQIRKKTEDFHRMLKKPGVYKVGRLGGCMLISKKVLKSDISFRRIYNLSFAGEDRHFCVRAAVKGFEMYVDTAFPAYHIYRVSDIPGCMVYKQQCLYKAHFDMSS